METSDKSEKKSSPLHITQAFDIKGTTRDLDFFDANLKFDSKLFIDPFLIQKSSIASERKLFDRFGDFFRFAYDKSLVVGENRTEYENLKLLLSFPEPKELNIGYTKISNKGSGPGPSFANRLLNFFLSRFAEKIIKEKLIYPDGRFNPVSLSIFTDGISHDGISDLTANLIMDYLILYTQKQAKLHGIPMRQLPIQEEGFDFENMRWRGGAYKKLPENPIREGEAIIFVPKRLLRASETEQDNLTSRVKDILLNDENLSRKFAEILIKRVDEIDIEEVRKIIWTENSVFKNYIKLLGQNRVDSYDFEKDRLGFLDIKKYHDLFKNFPNEDVTSCQELLEHSKKLIQIAKKQLSETDGWKDMWKDDTYKIPQREAVFGRSFRAMGFAYFEHLPNVTFEPEVGTGNGLVDFKVIYKNCRVVIEIKKIENDTPTGKPPIKAYLHGIERQLPQYAILSKSNFAIYLTGQHFTSLNRPKNNHDQRVIEINNQIESVEQKIKKEMPDFKELLYFNIDFSPKPTASKI